MRTYFLIENFKNSGKLENEEVENILKYVLNLRTRTFNSLEHSCKHWTVRLKYDSSINSSVTTPLLILPLKLLFLTMQAGAKDTQCDSVSHPDTVCFLFPHFLQQCFSSCGLFGLCCLSNPWLFLSDPAKSPSFSVNWPGVSPAIHHSVLIILFHYTIISHIWLLFAFAQFITYIRHMLVSWESIIQTIQLFFFFPNL